MSETQRSLDRLARTLSQELFGIQKAVRLTKKDRAILAYMARTNRHLHMTRLQRLAREGYVEGNSLDGYAITDAGREALEGGK